MTRPIRKQFLIQGWNRFLAGPGWLRPSHGLNFVFQYYRSPTLKLLFWAMAWYDRLFSLPMRLLIIVIIIFGFLATLTMNSPAVPFLLFLVSLLFLDTITGWFFRPRLTVHRILPERVKCGVPFVVTYEGTNRRNLPTYGLLFDPNIELAELRRTEGYRYHSLCKHQTFSFRTELVALKRGVYPIPQGLAESAFPFNLIKHSILFGKRETLFVHPSTIPVHDFLSKNGILVFPHETNTIAHPGESMNFYGCRQYRPGDSPRRIHWRATARHLTPIVKEYQEEHSARVAIFLDSFRHPADTAKKNLRVFFSGMTGTILNSKTDVEFEAAVSLAASVAEMLICDNYQIRCLTIGKEIFHFRDKNQSDETGEQLMDLLATATGSMRDAYAFPAFVQTLADATQEIDIAFLILLRYDRHIQTLLDELTEHKIHVIPILVTNNPDALSPSQFGTISMISPQTVLNGDEAL